MGDICCWLCHVIPGLRGCDGLGKGLIRCFCDPLQYDPQFGDAFWNSSKYNIVSYLLRIMTSWAIVCNVWYLPPMVRKVISIWLDEELDCVCKCTFTLFSLQNLCPPHVSKSVLYWIFVRADWCMIGLRFSWCSLHYQQCTKYAKDCSKCNAVNNSNNDNVPSCLSKIFS